MGIAFSTSLEIQTYDAEMALPVEARKPRASEERHRKKHRHHNHYDPSERLLSRDGLAMQKRVRAETQAAAGKTVTSGMKQEPDIRKLEAVRGQQQERTAGVGSTSKARLKHPLAQMMLPEQSSDQGSVNHTKSAEIGKTGQGWEKTSLSKISPAHLEAMDLADLLESLLEHPNDHELEYTAEEKEILRDIVERAAKREREEERARKPKSPRTREGDKSIVKHDGVAGKGG